MDNGAKLDAAVHQALACDFLGIVDDTALTDKIGAFGEALRLAALFSVDDFELANSVTRIRALRAGFVVVRECLTAITLLVNAKDGDKISRQSIAKWLYLYRLLRDAEVGVRNAQVQGVLQDFLRVFREYYCLNFNVKQFELEVEQCRPSSF